MKKEDLFFIISPFLLTSVFIIVGYSILVAQTPEASISLSTSENSIEFIDETDVQIISPQSDFPEFLVGPIVSVAQNQTALDALLSEAKKSNATVLYISVPVTMISNNSFVLADASSSNEENVMRWTKKLINQAHAEGLHVVVGLTINASTTIDDPATFAVSYSNFIEKWATLANESSVSALQPGITIGHPLYSNITTQDMDKISATILTKMRQKYLGKIGINMCCSLELEPNLSQYSFLSVIPTPEFPFIDLETQARKIQTEENLDFIIYYDKDRAQVTHQMP